MAKKSLHLEDNFNPAMQFISTSITENADDSDIEETPEGHKISPNYIETRSKRLQLLLQPSLYEKLKAKAEREGSSVNNTLHKILEEALVEK